MKFAFVGFLFYFAFSTFAISSDDLTIASEKLRKTSGRIIRVTYKVGYIEITNVCSATLIDNNKIITAAHCFYTTPTEKESGIFDEVLSYIKGSDEYSREVFHFDIDGITSQDLFQNISKISDVDKKIKGKNKVYAKLLIRKMPKISKVKLHPNYIESANKTANTPEAPEPAHDVAVGHLDRKLNVGFLKVSDYRDEDTVFLAGHPGMSLHIPLNVIPCTAGTAAYQELVTKVDFSTERTGGKNNSKASNDEDKNRKLTRYRHFYETAIIEVCNEIIVRGYSGGPHVVVRDNEVYIVGITSQLFESYMGISGNKVAASIAMYIKDLSF